MRRIEMLSDMNLMRGELLGFSEIRSQRDLDVIG
jgi:hypothetical protein